MIAYCGGTKFEAPLEFLRYDRGFDLTAALPSPVSEGNPQEIIVLRR